MNSRHIRTLTRKRKRSGGGVILLRLLLILALGSVGLLVGAAGLIGGTAFTVYASFAAELPPPMRSASAAWMPLKPPGSMTARASTSCMRSSLPTAADAPG